MSPPYSTNPRDGMEWKWKKARRARHSRHANADIFFFSVYTAKQTKKEGLLILCRAALFFFRGSFQLFSPVQYHPTSIYLP